jgi:hypothetical protein
MSTPWVLGGVRGLGVVNKGDVPSFAVASVDAGVAAGAAAPSVEVTAVVTGTLTAGGTDIGDVCAVTSTRLIAKPTRPSTVSRKEKWVGEVMRWGGLGKETDTKY